MCPKQAQAANSSWIEPVFCQQVSPDQAAKARHCVRECTGAASAALAGRRKSMLRLTRIGRFLVVSFCATPRAAQKPMQPQDVAVRLSRPLWGGSECMLLLQAALLTRAPVAAEVLRATPQDWLCVLRTASGWQLRHGDGRCVAASGRDALPDFVGSGDAAALIETFSVQYYLYAVEEREVADSCS